jgi:hypothetical protein
VSANVVALIAGTVLAVGALAFVLYPLFFDAGDEQRPRAARRDAPEDSAILALREIEFDRATGKLSDADYAELKTIYSARALAELRGADSAAAPPDAASTDPIEARVRAFRETHRDCPTCGLRPEPDAIYCSTCGRYLAGDCPACGSAIAESSAAFCSKCGATLVRPSDGAFATSR